jgi:hypothetical protein
VAVAAEPSAKLLVRVLLRLISARIASVMLLPPGVVGLLLVWLALGLLYDMSCPDSNAVGTAASGECVAVSTGSGVVGDAESTAVVSAAVVSAAVVSAAVVSAAMQSDARRDVLGSIAAYVAAC